MARVLLVSADSERRVELTTALSAAGHQVESAASGGSGLLFARAWHPDLVILDVDLPDTSGIATCRALRADAATLEAFVFAIAPIPDEAERVEAFEAGVDDLVSRPYSKREVMLRLNVLLRRRRARATPAFVSVGDLRIDAAARRVVLDSNELDLTRREFDVLLLLAQGHGRVYTRESLVAQLWPEEVASVRVVDTTIKRLRPKLGRAASSLQTVRGAGYRLAIDIESD